MTYETSTPPVTHPLNLDTEHRALLLRAMALTMGDLDNAPTIARAHGLPEETILDLLATDDGYAAATAELERLRDSGEWLRHTSLRALDTGVKRLHRALMAEDTTPGTVARIAAELFKMSGLAEERAAKLRREAAQTGTVVHMITHFEGDPELPPEKPGELRLVIFAPPGVRRDAKPVDGEVIDA